MALTAEQQAFRDRVQKISKEKVAPRAEEIDSTNEFPWDLMEIMRKEKLAGLLVPKEYGGLGADLTSIALLNEALAGACGGFAMAMATSNLAPLLPMRFGTEEAKKRYLPKLAEGALANMVCISEEHAGTDMGAIKSTGVKEGDHWVINAEKWFTEPAETADMMHVFVKTAPEKGSRGISGFIVEREMAGFGLGRVALGLGIRGAGLAEIVLRDLKVPEENMLGAPGEGIKVARLGMELGMIACPLSVGLAQSALDLAVDHAKTRMAFGKRLCEFQAIQFMLVDMSAEIEAARAMHYDGCARADRGENDARVFPMTHNFANSVAIKVSDMALEVFGGHAVLDWAHPVCRVMRDIRSTCIAAGGGPNMKRMVSARELFA